MNKDWRTIPSHHWWDFGKVTKLVHDSKKDRGDKSFNEVVKVVIKTNAKTPVHEVKNPKLKALQERFQEEKQGEKERKTQKSEEKKEKKVHSKKTLEIQKSAKELQQKRVSSQVFIKKAILAPPPFKKTNSFIHTNSMGMGRQNGARRKSCRGITIGSKPLLEQIHDNKANTQQTVEEHKHLQSIQKSMEQLQHEKEALKENEHWKNMTKEVAILLEMTKQKIAI